MFNKHVIVTEGVNTSGHLMETQVSTSNVEPKFPEITAANIWVNDITVFIFYDERSCEIQCSVLSMSCCFFFIFFIASFWTVNHVLMDAFVVSLYLSFASLNESSYSARKYIFFYTGVMLRFT